MASMLNIANVLGNKKKNPDEEQTLLTMWAAKDSDSKTHCMCVRWAPDDSILASGCGDGIVRLFGSDGRLKERLGSLPPPSGGGAFQIVNEKDPVMSMRFQPNKENKLLLRVATADGEINLFDLKTKQSRATVQEKDKLNGDKQNSTLAMDISEDGQTWATGGSDRIIRIYNTSDAKGSKVKELRGSMGDPGHANRICAVRLNVSKPGLVASAGLDGTVMLWDYRSSSPSPFARINDVEVCGDAIDYDGNTLLTGSWRPAQQLQIWDLRSPDTFRDVKWKKPAPKPSGGGGRWSKVRDAIVGSTNVYGAQFVRSGPLKDGIVAGGTGSNEIKVFKPITEENCDPIGSLKVTSGVHGLHVNSAGTLIGVAAVDGTALGVKMPDYTAPAQPVTQ